MCVAVVFVDEGGDVGEGDVWQSVEDEEKPGGSEGWTLCYRLDFHAFSYSDADSCYYEVEDEVIDEVGDPVGRDAHSTDYLLMFGPVLSFFDDEGDDGSEFEGQSDGEDEGGKKSWDSVV